MRKQRKESEVVRRLSVTKDRVDRVEKRLREAEEERERFREANMNLALDRLVLLSVQSFCEDVLSQAATSSLTNREKLLFGVLRAGKKHLRHGIDKKEEG